MNHKTLAACLTAASKSGYTYRVKGALLERKLPLWSRWRFVCYASDVVKTKDGFIDVTDGAPIEA